jgi:hypothetical protein
MLTVTRAVNISLCWVKSREGRLMTALQTGLSLELRDLRAAADRLEALLARAEQDMTGAALLLAKLSRVRRRLEALAADLARPAARRAVGSAAVLPVEEVGQQPSQEHGLIPGVGEGEPGEGDVLPGQQGRTGVART